MVLLLSLFAPVPTFALTCARPGIELFPPPGDIPPNPVFILYGGGTTAEFFRGITAASFDFSPGGKHVRARILERGEGFNNYVMLAPVVPLLPEGTLGLRLLRGIAGQDPQWTSLGVFNVRGPPDEISPTVIQLENRATARAQNSGWGESITAPLPVAADESPVLWLASIESAESPLTPGQPVAMFLSSPKPALYSGPCGANYPIEHGQQYLVDLTPIDAAGHRGKATGPALLVDIP